MHALDTVAEQAVARRGINTLGVLMFGNEYLLGVKSVKAFYEATDITTGDMHREVRIDKSIVMTEIVFDGYVVRIKGAVVLSSRQEGKYSVLLFHVPKGLEYEIVADS